MVRKVFFLTMLLSNSVHAQQFFASAEVANTVMTAETLPSLLRQRNNKDTQFELEYRSAEIVKQLENSASLPQLLQRLQYWQAFSATHPAVLEFLHRDVFDLANARWRDSVPPSSSAVSAASMPNCVTNETRCANIAFLHNNPFVFTALDQLPRAYTYVNAMLPLAAPRAAALAVFEPQQALHALFSISEPLVFFSSLALLRRVLIYYGQPLPEFEALVAQHSQRLLRRTQVTQATVLAFSMAMGWKAGLKKLLRKKKLPKRMLPLLLPLSFAYLITEQALAPQRQKLQQAMHYSDQIFLYLVQEK